MILVIDRQRRENIRRLVELTEVIPVVGDDGKYHIKLNTLFKFQLKTGELERANPSQKLFRDLQQLSGYSINEIKNNLNEKKLILEWLVNKNIDTVNTVGKTVAEYYKSKDAVLKIVADSRDPKEVLGKFVGELS